MVLMVLVVVVSSEDTHHSLPHNHVAGSVPDRCQRGSNMTPTTEARMCAVRSPRAVGP